MELEELMKMMYEAMHVQEAKITITQYDSDDCAVASYTGEFKTIFDNIPDFEKYYYRVTAFGKHEGFKRVTTNYYGVKTTSIGGFRLTEESYVNSVLNYMIKCYAKAKKMGLSTSDRYNYNFACVMDHDFWYIDQMKNVRQNTKEKFNYELKQLLKKFHSFKRIENLNELEGQNGIYLLVLDEYNCCYWGQSNNMRKRIMKHWSRNDYFSGTGIDMFKAYDTTRIYAAVTEGTRRTNELEHKVIQMMPPRYTLNCLAGGDGNQLVSHKKSILKPDNEDREFINYKKVYYSIEERIRENEGRFIV